MGLAATVTSLFTRRPAAPSRKDAFDDLVRVWQQRCADFPVKFAPRADGRKFAVLVTPWLGTAASFFNMEVARMLAADGENVRVIFDCCNVFGNAPVPHEVEGLETAVRALPPELPVIRVRENTGASETAADEEAARRVIYENGIWRTRGETSVAKFVERKEGSLARLTQHVARVRELIASSGIEWLLVPGGVWGISGLYVAATQAAGVHLMTYDSGKRAIVVCQDGIATHQADIVRAFPLVEKLLARHPEQRARVLEWSRRELGERTAGRGSYLNFQKQAATGRAEGDANIFVPLNLRWDSAALSRTRLFPTVEEWLTELVQWVATEPAARLCIRQHPAERNKVTASSDDVGALVRKINTAGDRVRFVAAEDPVNSYDLLRTARVVLPFTSTLGMEAPMLGIPVVTSAKNYYETFRFASRAESPEHYFQLIGQAIRGELTVSPEASEEAALVYYLTQHCNFLLTVFTAEATEFLEWAKLPPNELWSRSDTLDLKRAIHTGEPIAAIRFSRSLAESPDGH
ncbi:MAG: hypothetical protein WCF18_04330 [Chthoniobacteraceae bacterium]